MKKITVVLLGITLSLFSAEPAKNAELRKKCEEVETIIKDRQGQLISLKKREKSLNIAAAVTMNEKNRPELRNGKSRVLLSLPLNSTEGWFGIPIKKGYKMAIVSDGPHQAFECGGNRFPTYSRMVPLTAGKTIVIQVKMKYENVKALRRNGGTRVGMLLKTHDKRTLWPGIPSMTGTHDWMPVRLKVELPDNLESGMLMLGLAGGEGRVLFRDLVIEEQL